MRGSLKLFTWFGIPVHLHWSFGLILLFAVYSRWNQGDNLLGIAMILALFVAVFGCILLHEFGHSLTARRYGIKTQDIILTPIGGMARLERMPEKPFQEFVVAIAGPLVNVVIAIALFVLGKFLFVGDHWNIFMAFIEDSFAGLVHFFTSLGQLLKGSLGFDQFSAALNDAPASKMDDILKETGLQPGILLETIPVLLICNIWLVLFNLIPAFPMDGGRVLRALLAMQVGRSRATQVATMVGQVIAVFFIVFGVWQSQYMLAAIGFFVFTIARNENRMVQIDDLLRRFKVRDLMRQQFTRLSLNDWMQTPIDLLQQGSERNFLVFNMQDNLSGILGEEAIITALKKRDMTTEVSSYMIPEWESIDQTETLYHAFHLLRQKGYDILPVVDQKGVIGVVDEPGILYFLQLQQNLSND